MDLLQLKMLPDRAALVADAIERDIEKNDDYLEIQQLTEVLAWLRYRVTKWVNEHPAPPVA